jgi:CheY-like chemotaxis protein
LTVPFEVVMAVDGQKGLEMATSETPDIILLDMSLPIMDVSRLLI